MAHSFASRLGRSRRRRWTNRRAFHAAFGAAVGLLTAAGCDPGEAKTPWPESGAMLAAPLPDRRPAPPGQPLFQALPAERTGIDFAANWPHHLPHYQALLDSEKAGGGVAIGDYTGDGRPDVFLTRSFGGSRLYRNLGDFRFTDATEEAGVLETFAADAGATFADVNNNGLLDLFVCAHDSPNRLYINRGDGTFVERAAEYGLDYRGASVMAAFADYTGNGYLDLYLAVNRLALTEGPRDPPPQIIENPDGTRGVADEHRDFWEMLNWTDPDGTPRHWLIRAGQRDRLFRNNGDPGAPGFTEVTDDAGIAGHHMTLAATWWDYNGNGLPDLYVATDFYGPDQLYRNNGDGTFTEVIGRFTGRTPWFSMGADTADINNSGRLDFMGTDMAETTHYGRMVQVGAVQDAHWFRTLPEPRQITRNTLYLNAGVDRFLEVAPMLGLDKTDWTWAILFGDLNNTGWNDLLITNGMTLDGNHGDRRGMWLDQMPPKPDQNLAFRNTGDLRFDDAGAEWGLDHKGVSFGAAMGDLNGNGNLDIIVNNFDEPVSVYRNTEADRRRVKVRLKGRLSNSHGIGATVRIRTAAGRQMRYLTLSRGFMSSSEPVVHFGLGEVHRIDRLTVEWPSGHVQEFADLSADHLYTIVEPSTPAPQRARHGNH